MLYLVRSTTKNTMNSLGKGWRFDLDFIPFVHGTPG
jgi:hypothetical protein